MFASSDDELKAMYMSANTTVEMQAQLEAAATHAQKLQHTKSELEQVALSRAIPPAGGSAGSGSSPQFGGAAGYGAAQYSASMTGQYGAGMTGQYDASAGQYGAGTTGQGQYGAGQYGTGAGAGQYGAGAGMTGQYGAGAGQYGAGAGQYGAGAGMTGQYGASAGAYGMPAGGGNTVGMQYGGGATANNYGAGPLLFRLNYHDSQIRQRDFSERKLNKNNETAAGYSGLFRLKCDCDGVNHR